MADYHEIEPKEAYQRRDELHAVDVRAEHEFDGPLGHVAGAVLVPLGDLEARAGELSKGRPMVTVCRSGARSAQATVILKKAGFGRVANMAGGMLRWRAQQLPAEGALD